MTTTLHCRVPFLKWLMMTFIAAVSLACSPSSNDGGTPVTAPSVSSTAPSSVSSIPADGEPPTPTTLGGGGETIAVPNVYREDATRGIARLKEAGLLVIAYEVCSATVAKGQIRQVRLAAGTELVGVKGVTKAGQSVERSTVVEVKVGTGQAC